MLKIYFCVKNLCMFAQLASKSSLDAFSCDSLLLSDAIYWGALKAGVPTYGAALSIGIFGSKGG